MIHDWNYIAREQLNPLIVRQAVHTDRMTVAHLHLTKGAVVPRHSHANEQVTVLERGRLRFEFDDGAEIVEAGQMLQIAGGRAHSVEALEDSLALDLFSPRREDWIRGDDAYLRHK
ncbi:MAG TPA: cupin domain-containing protein [Bryobacteraceae bacterium]|nr:cupin domain-containing protein [Bryobacteraceae bacterium]